MGLVAVTIFAGGEFTIRGGKGRVRSWAETQAALMKAMLAWLVRQEHRSSGGAKSSRVLVLKKIVQLKRRVRLALQCEAWFQLTAQL